MKLPLCEEAATDHQQLLPAPGTHRLQLSKSFIHVRGGLLYEKSRTFFHKNKNAAHGGFSSATHTPPFLKKMKLWCLISVPDVCVYLFISIFIVFAVKPFASLGAFQKF